MPSDSHQLESSRRRSREASLRYFTSLLNTQCCIESCSDESKSPKTRLDLLLSRQSDVENYAGKAKEEFSFPSTFPLLSMFSPSCLPETPAAATIPTYGAEVSCQFKDGCNRASILAQETAVRNLGRPMQYNRNTIANAPDNMARNAASSFISLVKSNLNQFFKLHILSCTKDKVCGTETARRFGASFFQNGGIGRASARCADDVRDTKTPIVLNTVSISFRIPAKSEESGVITSFPAENESAENMVESLELPIAMKIVFDMKINGTHVSVPVDGLGTITGYFDDVDNDLIERVDVALHSAQFLFSLRQKARLVAYQALQGYPVPLLQAASSHSKHVFAVLPPLSQSDSYTNSQRLPNAVTPSTSPMLSSAEPPNENQNLGHADLIHSAFKHSLESARSLPPKKRRTTSSQAGQSSTALRGMDILMNMQK